MGQTRFERIYYVKLFIQVMIKTIRKKQHPVFFHREKKAKFLQG